MCIFRVALIGLCFVRGAAGGYPTGTSSPVRVYYSNVEQISVVDTRTYSSKYSIDFSTPRPFAFFSSYPRFTILLILFRDLANLRILLTCAPSSMCRHVFRLSANSSSLVIADSRLLRMVINEVAHDRCRIGHWSGF